MYKFNFIIAFSILTAIYLTSFYFFNTYILKDTIYFDYLKSEYSDNLINSFVENAKKINYISNFIYPVLLFLKLVLTSIIIYIGIHLFEINITIKNCFKISLLSEFILSISSVFKTLFLYLYPPNNLIEIQNFNPLGLSILLKNCSIPKFLLYPILQINLFEVIYWLLLAYGIKNFGNINFKKAIKITALSYGVGFAIWCIFVVFLQLQFN